MLNGNHESLNITGNFRCGTYSTLDSLDSQATCVFQLCVHAPMRHVSMPRDHIEGSDHWQSRGYSVAFQCLRVKHEVARDRNATENVSCPATHFLEMSSKFSA